MHANYAALNETLDKKKIKTYNFYFFASAEPVDDQSLQHQGGRVRVNGHHRQDRGRKANRKSSTFGRLGFRENDGRQTGLQPLVFDT